MHHRVKATAPPRRGMPLRNRQQCPRHGAGRDWPPGSFVATSAAGKRLLHLCAMALERRCGGKPPPPRRFCPLTGPGGFPQPRGRAPSGRKVWLTSIIRSSVTPVQLEDERGKQECAAFVPAQFQEMRKTDRFSVPLRLFGSLCRAVPRARDGSVLAGGFAQMDLQLPVKVQQAVGHVFFCDRLKLAVQLDVQNVGGGLGQMRVCHGGMVRL